MSEREWLPPEQWFAGLAKNIASAGALFTDSSDRVLIVKPNYRDHWLMVGGLVEEDETPELACRREVREEIGVDRSPGRPLLVDWTSASVARPLPLIEFIFDGGVLEPGQVRLDDEELDEYRFLPQDRAMDLLSGNGRRRLTAALEARRTGVTLYRSDGG
ncbi:NUDIX domain-containing protein [Salininema proteolyticum]|uniref:NUDIX domain-containing protein n=1 Tax=Salininema proteolyticum TaxID=1607685 RepID=A0ABV8TYT7_9ACTN